MRTFKTSDGKHWREVIDLTAWDNAGITMREIMVVSETPNSLGGPSPRLEYVFVVRTPELETGEYPYVKNFK